MASVVDVIKEPTVPSLVLTKRGIEGGFPKDVSRSFHLWLYTLLFSLLALHIILLFKAIFPEQSPNWFLDVFANTGIIMVSAIMAVTAALESILRKKINIPIMVVLFILAIFCYMEYSVIMVNGPEAGQDKLPIPDTLARINLVVFAVVLVFGLLSFVSLSGYFKRLSEKLKERKKK
jgi:cation transport ATPase